MRKLEGKRSLLDESYPRMNHSKEEPVWRALRAAREGLKSLSKDGVTERSNKDTSVVYKSLKSIPTPKLKGITSPLPTFDGSSNVKFISWLDEINYFFENNCLNELEKYRVGVSCLKGPALFWHTSLILSRMTIGKSTIKTWSKLEHYLKKEYLFPYHIAKSRDRLKEGRQKLLDLVGNVKPHTTPSPNLESKLENVEVYLEPEPEIVKQIDLSSACSFGDVGCDTSTCIVVPLGTLECESLNFSYPNTKNEGTSLSSEPLKPPRTNPTLTHCDTHTHTPLPTETTCQETCLFFPNKDEKDHLKVERNKGLNVKILNQPCFKYPHSETGLKRRNMSFRNSLQDLGLPTKFMSPMSIKTEFIIRREDMGGFDKGKSKFLILVFDPGEKRKCNW